jgi:hypothetical protein
LDAAFFPHCGDSAKCRECFVPDNENLEIPALPFAGGLLVDGRQRHDVLRRRFHRARILPRRRDLGIDLGFGERRDQADLNDRAALLVVAGSLVGVLLSRIHLYHPGM